MSTSLKLLLTDVTPVGQATPDAEADQYQLSFIADYNDGRNSEWAKYTPSASLTVVVTAEALEAAGFQRGAWDCTLTPAGEHEAAQHAGDPELSAQVAGIADAAGGEPAFNEDGTLKRPGDATDPTDAKTDTAATPEAAAPKSKR